MDIFFELHKDLPREGPGDNQSTRRALELVADLPPRPAILDVGCGPGMQTLELARATSGQITAADTHRPFLDSLARSAAAAGLSDRITPLQASMFALNFPPGSFDLIWSEGAIYIMGFEQGLRAWRPLLKPGGCVAVTEISWLRPDPPEDLARYWNENYPGMQSTGENLAILSACGYRELGHFTLPTSSWWDNYYHPLQDRIVRLRRSFPDDQAFRELLDSNELEMDLYRKYSDWYGYVFYVMQVH